MTPAARQILVTGAAGFIGRHTVHACTAAGYRVTGVDRRHPSTEFASSARWLRGDCTTDDLIAEIATGRYAAVVHQAGISDTRAPDTAELYEVNVHGPLRIARACLQSGTRLIYASSHSVYGRLHTGGPIAEAAVADRALCTGALNPYARSKLALDRAMQTQHGGSPLRWIGLRYTNVIGPDETDKGPMASIATQLVRQAATSGRVRVFADTLLAARDYIPVDIVTRTVAQLIEADIPSGVYNLGSGHATVFAELLQWCALWLGNEQPLHVEMLANPVAAAYQYFTCADMTALDHALPGRPAATVADIRDRLGSLFQDLRQGSRAPQHAALPWDTRPGDAIQGPGTEAGRAAANIGR